MKEDRVFNRRPFSSASENSQTTLNKNYSSPRKNSDSNESAQKGFSRPSSISSQKSVPSAFHPALKQSRLQQGREFQTNASNIRSWMQSGPPSVQATQCKTHQACSSGEAFVLLRTRHRVSSLTHNSTSNKNTHRTNRKVFRQMPRISLIDAGHPKWQQTLQPTKRWKQKVARMKGIKPQTRTRRESNSKQAIGLVIK